MKNSLRFTFAHIALASATAAGVLSLTACGGGDPAKADGNLDDVKKVAAVKAVPAKTHKETKRVAKTKRVCTGTGTKRRCSNVADGFKTETRTVTDKPGKPGKPSLYCVELDNVDGDSKNDDQWFEVSESTYSDHEDEAEGKEVFSMEYSRMLASCKR